jgi:serine/threonine protein kinase
MQGQVHNETAWTFPGYFPPGENRILPAFYDKFGRGAKPWTLPHPDEIQKQAENGTDSSSTGSRLYISPSGIAVRWGGEVSTAEAISLLTIDTYIGRECPIPKVYGWYSEPAESGSQKLACTFIYMEHIRGQSLAERYNTLKPQELKYITRQLCKAVAGLRSLKAADEPSIGSIERKALPDKILARYWKDVPFSAGPFPTVAAFHEALASIARVRFNLPPETPIQKRSELPSDDTPIVFTHGDLSPENIIITAPGDGPARLAGIVGWNQAGWYPAYWEIWKARLSTNEGAGSAWWVELLMEATTFQRSAAGTRLFLQSCYQDKRQGQEERLGSIHNK